MERRKFLTSKFMESMVSLSLTDYEVESSVVSVNELRGEPVYNSINNKALLGTLRNLGITGERVDEIKAQKGDVIYSVRVEGLNGKMLHEFSEDSQLPSYATLVIRKNIIK